MRILLVEDERKVASFIARALREDAHAVDIAETGEQALEMSEGVAHDLIVLDVRLPGLSGIQVCRELRQAGNSSPVLMLTARGIVEQRVEGLDAGADDYLPKPFSSEELLARVRAVLRRVDASWRVQSEVLELGPIQPRVFDLARHQERFVVPFARIAFVAG